MKQVKAEKDRLIDKNRELEEQIAKFQGDVKEAIKMHKDLAQKEAKMEQMQREIEHLRTEKTLLQDALD
jgi:predicted nuclease with TOPRIM domain